MPRKTTSHFGKALQDGLLNEQVWLKAEDLPSFLPFYVDQGHLNRLLDNANQLVVGRRGTGKTHLLGAFNEFVSNARAGDAAIKISILEANPKTPPSLTTESPEFASRRMAGELYDGFLRVFFKRFLEFAHVRLQTLKQDFGTDHYKELFTNTNDRLTQLLEAIEVGRPFPIRRSKRSKEITNTDGQGALQAEFGAGFTGAKPSIKAHIKAVGGRAAQNTSASTTKIDTLLGVDLFDVRELILDVLDLLQINTLYILIDEWMELDKHTPSRLQAGFAQLLKATFFNSARFSVKIASVWHETTLYDRNDLDRSKGIQIGHDIEMAADLDSAFLTQPEDIYEFCKQLLFKRLSHVCEELKRLQDKDGNIDDFFITEIFDNSDNYKAFIAASHGIPRDIMNIFHICSLRIKRNFTAHCIDHKLIMEVARDRYKIQKRKQIEPNSPAQKLLKMINQYMEETGRRLFIVENSEADSAALRKLVDEEVIHQLPSSVTHRSISDTHKAFHIDYGNYADWITTKKTEITELLAEAVIPVFPKNFNKLVSKYTISVSSISEKKAECQRCGNIFDISHPVYKKATICPRCASDKVVVR